MAAAVLLLIILLALGPVASKIPAAVLAGILLTVGIGVMDYKGLKAIPNMPKSEVIIMIIVLLLSTFWNLVYAVGIGLIIASLVFMKNMGNVSAEKSKVKPLDEKDWDDETGVTEKMREKIFIKHLEGPLFFGSTSDFSKLAKQVPDEANCVIIRMDKVPYIDQSGLYALEDTLLDLEKRDIRQIIVGLQNQPRYLMSSIDIIPNLVPEEHLFETFSDCFQWMKKNALT